MGGVKKLILYIILVSRFVVLVAEGKWSLFEGGR